MNFNKHFSVEGKHAFLGASKYHWVNYDEDKLANAYLKYQATLKGTILHEFAAQCIKLGQKLPKSQKTLNMYVNDAIGYKMTPEQVLYYSDNCFGTTTCTFTYKFPTPDHFTCLSPSFLSLNEVSVCVPAGIVSFAFLPSIVGTST